MNTMSLKVPDALANDLTELARLRGMSRSALIRDVLEAYLEAAETGGARSALSRVADLAGSLAGPGDLSVNKEYLKDFGR